MKSMYYTTAEVKALFGWESTTTIHRKQASDFLPLPDLEGRPNKWLKTKIDAIINGNENTKKDDA